MIRDELTKKKEEFLELCSTIGISESTIKKSNYKIDIFIDFLISNGRKPDKDSLDEFMKYAKEERGEMISQHWITATHRAIYKFVYYCHTGDYIIMENDRPLLLGAPLGSDIEKFLKHLFNAKRLASETVSNYRIRLKQFNDYLREGNLTLSADAVRDYFIVCNENGASNYKLYGTMLALKKFFEFMCREDGFYEPLINAIPKVKYLRQVKLPSYYTDDEIRALINSVNRNCPTGKRNYAIILFFVLYGLRCSDVCNLKFENFDWENSSITITQQKTKKTETLGILPVVGNAIIDYLKNARPDCSEPFVFLTDSAPIRKMTQSAMYSIVKKYMEKANINTEGKRHGPHSLRHSYASRMLKDNVPLPIISEAMGHSDTQVTTVYTSIDINSLRKCALPMPEVTSEIYCKGDYSDDSKD